MDQSIALVSALTPVAALAGCVGAQTIDARMDRSLPQPRRHRAPKLGSLPRLVTPAAAPGFLTAASLTIALRPRFEVVGNGPKELERQCREESLQLQEIFGAPAWTGLIHVEIDGGLSEHGKMVSRNRRLRSITLHPASAAGRMYVVHELFHALYQRTDFIEAAPQLLVEGLATYAQYRCLDPDLDAHALHGMLLDDLTAMAFEKPRAVRCLDVPFDLLDSQERRALYLLGALFVAQQVTLQGTDVIEMYLGLSRGDEYRHKCWSCFLGWAGLSGLGTDVLFGLN